MGDTKNTNRELLDEIDKLKVDLDEIKEKYLKTKNANDILFNERKMFLSLTDSVPYGIYRVKLISAAIESQKQWKKQNELPVLGLFANERFCSIMNIQKDDFINNPGILYNYIYKEDLDDFIKKNAEANPDVRFKWDGRLWVNEKIIWVHFESVPSRLKNGDSVWTGILYDITERIEAEKEIIEINQELKKMNAEKDKFFSIIAHDLKSPFNSILGFSELLVEQIQNNNLEGINQYSEIILNSSRKANNLLSNLMEWSQLQTGRMSAFPEYFELNIEINNVILLYTEIANHKAINLSSNTPNAIIGYADKHMTNTVLRNLVSNAIKFTEYGGKINISAKSIKNEILITVSDSGVGIPDESMKKLFRIEENFTTQGTQNEKGTGLGLLLCKEFIEKNEGKIWVESQKGNGSNFYFTIPNRPS